MEAILYAEIYLFCIIIVWLCIYWSDQRSSHSASERWLHAALIGFLVSFIANFLFTLFNRILPPLFLTRHASWLFKTVYHVMLCFGVFAWCGYADTECRGDLFITRKRVVLSAIPLLAMVGLIVSNLWTHRLFAIDEHGYTRGKLFHLEMGILVAVTAAFSVKLLIHASHETDPIKRGHMCLVASFPLCLAVAWVLSLAGEAFPIICVAITIELLCLYMGTSTQQISMDKLTQVNNRQNLLSFLDYKVLNHSERLFLFMMDLDYFKKINDTYGHLEGDDALIRAAKALKMACGNYRRRPYIARYGGDEFIVVIESTKAEADALLASIHENLENLNKSSNKPYKLALSIGVGEFHPGMDANALIEAADSELYKIKRARPGEHER